MLDDILKQFSYSSENGIEHFIQTPIGHSVGRASPFKWGSCGFIPQLGHNKDFLKLVLAAISFGIQH